MQSRSYLLCKHKKLSLLKQIHTLCLKIDLHMNVYYGKVFDKMGDRDHNCIAWFGRWSSSRCHIFYSILYSLLLPIYCPFPFQITVIAHKILCNPSPRISTDKLYQIKVFFDLKWTLIKFMYRQEQERYGLLIHLSHFVIKNSIITLFTMEAWIHDKNIVLKLS